MAKTTTALNPKTGTTYAITKAMKASESNAIPWTPGPQTLAQKIKRNLIG